METWVRESRLADAVLHEFRKRPHPLFIRNWQVIGPFPESSKLENATALESDEIQAERTYQGLQGKIGWKPLQAPSDRIDLGKLFVGKKSGVAYAGCWIHSKIRQAALIKLTSADRARVWVHGGSKFRIAIDEPFFRDAGTASNLAQVELSSGWNEILILLESRSGRWNFSLELRNKDNSQPLTEVQIQAKPPKKEEKEKDQDQ